MYYINTKTSSVYDGTNIMFGRNEGEKKKIEMKSLGRKESMKRGEKSDNLFN